MTTSRPTTEHAPSNHDDRRKITDVVARYETAFNTNDAAAMNALFTEDTAFVNIAGTLVNGADALYRSQAFVFGDGGPLAEVKVDYEVESLAFLAPDVAVVHARQHSVDDRKHPTATDTDLGESIVVFVLVRGAQGWRIRVGQNTAVG